MAGLLGMPFQLVPSSCFKSRTTAHAAGRQRHPHLRHPPSLGARRLRCRHRPQSQGQSDGSRRPSGCRSWSRRITRYSRRRTDRPSPRRHNAQLCQLPSAAHRPCRLPCPVAAAPAAAAPQNGPERCRCRCHRHPGPHGLRACRRACRVASAPTRPLHPSPVSCQHGAT
eukprot:366217-Chlamydomonas_euryale.AAC.24